MKLIFLYFTMIFLVSCSHQNFKEEFVEQLNFSFEYPSNYIQEDDTLGLYGNVFFDPKTLSTIHYYDDIYLELLKNDFNESNNDMTKNYLAQILIDSSYEYIKNIDFKTLNYSFIYIDDKPTFKLYGEILNSNFQFEMYIWNVNKNTSTVLFFNYNKKDEETFKKIFDSINIF